MQLFAKISEFINYKTIEFYCRPLRDLHYVEPIAINITSNSLNIYCAKMHSTGHQRDPITGLITKKKKKK